MMFPGFRQNHQFRRRGTAVWVNEVDRGALLGQKIGGMSIRTKKSTQFLRKLTWILKTGEGSCFFLAHEWKKEHGF